MRPKPACLLAFALAACGETPSPARYEAVAVVEIATPDGTTRAPTADDDPFLDTAVEKIRMLRVARGLGSALALRRTPGTWLVEVAATGDDPKPLADEANDVAGAFVAQERGGAPAASIARRKNLEKLIPVFEEELSTRKDRRPWTPPPPGHATDDVAQRELDELVLRRIALESRLRRDQGPEFVSIDAESTRAQATLDEGRARRAAPRSPRK